MAASAVIDPRTKNSHLREMAAKAIWDARGAKRGAA